MTDNQNPFADFDLERAIALRWTLRDIKGKRLKLSPVSESDLSALTNLGLVEMRDDVPVLTQAGHDALDGRNDFRAHLRHTDEPGECLFIEVDRKGVTPGQTDAIGPNPDQLTTMTVVISLPSTIGPEHGASKTISIAGALPTCKRQRRKAKGVPLGFKTGGRSTGMSTFRSTTVPADVFRPISSESSPVLLTYGPYAKGLPFQQDYLRKPEVDSVKLPWFD